MTFYTAVFSIHTVNAIGKVYSLQVPCIPSQPITSSSDIHICWTTL